MSPITLVLTDKDQVEDLYYDHKKSQESPKVINCVLLINFAEFDGDSCASSPCLYGSCIDGVYRYNCTCDHGYIGVNCEGR